MINNRDTKTASKEGAKKVWQRGSRPKKAPPKAWPPGKPPGGKLPEKSEKSDSARKDE